MRSSRCSPVDVKEVMLDLPEMVNSGPIGKFEPVPELDPKKPLVEVRRPPTTGWKPVPHVFTFRDRAYQLESLSHW
jgi:hypothetical protein